MWFGRLLVDKSQRDIQTPVRLLLCCRVLLLYSDNTKPEADYEGRVFLGLWFWKESPQ